MTCKELQQLLYSVRIKDFNPAEREFLRKHLADCEVCKAIFQEISKADRILARLKDATPRIRNEHVLTESIIAAIVRTERPMADVNANKFLDSLINVFSMKAVRFACSAIILLCGMSYLLMEYNDTKSIVLLEHKLGREQRNLLREANAFAGETNIVRLVNNVYKFAQEKFSSEELTDELRFMNTKDAQILMAEYRNLDEPVRTRLDKLRNNFLTNDTAELRVTRNAEGIHVLRHDIKELRKVLEPFIRKDKQP